MKKKMENNNPSYQDLQVSNDKLLQQIQDSAADLPIPESLEPKAVAKALSAQQKQLRIRRIRHISAAAVAIVLVIGISAYAISASLSTNNSGNNGTTLASDSSSDTENEVAGNQSASDNSNDSSAEESSSRTNGNSAARTNVKKSQVGDQYTLASDYEEVYTLLASAVSSSSIVMETAEDGDGTFGSSDSSDGISDGVSDAATKASADYSTTNTMVEGVDEADIVQINEHYLYMITGSSITITEITDGALTPVSTIDLELPELSTVEELYLDGDMLYILCSYTESTLSTVTADDSSESATTDMAWIYTDNTTELLAYSVTDPANPVPAGTITQDGGYNTSRKIGDYIYLFTTRQICEWEEESEAIPKVNGEKIACDCIYLPAEIGYICTELIITSIYTGNDAVSDVTDQMVIVNDSTVYVSENSIYIYDWYYSYEGISSENNSNGVDTDKNNSDNNDSNEVDSDETDSDEYDTGNYITDIAKFSFSDGILDAVNAISLPGMVDDEFALHESDGIFQILTTSLSAANNYEPVNQLYLYDEDLSLLGSLMGIAPGESIYAARYIGDIVYFITYENTDPLFAVDISDPTNPILLGQLEITGYSDYLHPYGDNLLLGVGYETDPDTGEELGIKLVMFDISDPLDPVVLDSVVVEGMDYIFSPDDYKAILADPQKNLIGFSLVDWGTTSWYETCCYQVYQWTDDGFELLLSADLESKCSMYAVRGLYSGDTFYLAYHSTGYYWEDTDYYYISSYDMAAEFKEIETLKY